MLCCRTATLYPLALGAFAITRKIVGVSGPGPGLSDSEAYAFLQAFFNPKLALVGLLLVVLLVRSAWGRPWLPFVALVGLATPQLDNLSSFVGPSSGLLNGLVLIHPPLLFFGYACLATLTLEVPKLASRILLSPRPHPLALRAFFVFLVALMLGAI